jgi:hypothetical protein
MAIVLLLAEVGKNGYAVSLIWTTQPLGDAAARGRLSWLRVTIYKLLVKNGAVRSRLNNLGHERLLAFDSLESLVDRCSLRLVFFGSTAVLLSDISI